MRLIRLLTPIVTLALTFPFAGCSDGADSTAPPAAITIETTTFAPSLGIDPSAAGWIKTASGLYYRVLRSPTEPTATVANGQRVSMAYTGWLANGTEFQSASYTFVLGSGAVIAGWDQGIVGMRVGERRRLLIPPALGYGARANGPIPANSVLVFDVEVLSAT